MLQRKQTIFLFFAFAVVITMFFTPIFTMSSVDGQIFFEIYGFFKNLGEDSLLIQRTTTVAIYGGILAILNFVAVFLFKNRKLQMRLVLIAIILSLAMYVLILLYQFVFIEIEYTSLNIGFSITCPLVSAILSFLAFKGIKKDDDLVKSSERFR